MFCQNPWLSGAALVSGFLYLGIQSGLKAVKRGSWMLIIPIISAIANPLFNHNGKTVFLFINNNPITLEAAIYGFCIGLSVSATLVWFTSFTEIMTSDKLLYVFGSISPKFALILSMTLRYIPLFKQQITKTNNAQKAMGLYKEDNIIDRLKGGMRIFSVMVTWALENGVITADSMTARGYGTGKRSRFAIFKWTRQDILIVAVTLIFGLYSFAEVISGGISIIWYPEIVLPESGPAQIITYCVYALLSFIPIVMQIKEEYRWKSLQSKI